MEQLPEQYGSRAGQSAFGRGSSRCYFELRRPSIESAQSHTFRLQFLFPKCIQSKLVYKLETLLIRTDWSLTVDFDSKSLLFARY